jgi:protein-S-isoprenylcysteine O-methyltransferase
MSKAILLYTGHVQIVLLVVLAVTGNLFSPDPWVIAAQALGVALIFFARASFGRQRFNISGVPADGPLLRRGPYRVIRHPMYAGALIIFVATIAGHPSLLAAIIGVVELTIVPWRIHIEEGLLKARYPDYGDYASSTHRLIPFIY